MTTILEVFPASGMRPALYSFWRARWLEMNDQNNYQRPIEVNDNDFQEQVLKSELPVLVEFWASWSEPCKILDSILSDLAAAFSGSTKIVKVNADDSLDLSLWYDIQSVPTLVYFVS